MGIDRPDEDDAPDVEHDSPAAKGDSPAVEGDAPAVEGDTSATAEPHASIDSDAGRRAYNVKYREIVAAEYQRAWDEAVPAFREAWAEHVRRYPHPEQSRPVPRSQPDGSWVADENRKLSPEQNAVVDRGYDQACEIGKNVILPTMRRIEAGDPDRHLAGLDNYLKDPDRLKEKIAADILYKDRTAEQALANVKDVVRFTFTYAEERYTETVLADCALMEASGFKRFDRQNSWEHDQYKGINSRWREPESKLLFEVQFHTQASFDAKELTHGAYERLRGDVAQDAERDELEAFQSAVSAKIPIPPGATEIEDYSLEERDG